MKKIKKTALILLALLTFICSFSSLNVFATENVDEDVLEDSDYCNVILTLKDFDTKETDNITFSLKNKKTKVATEVVFTKKNEWKATVSLEPGEYSIDFSKADENREVVLGSNVLEVSEAKSAGADLTVKKVLNNNFLPKFFRNNTFTLILLAVSLVAYYILKKKRENSVYIRE